MTVIQMTLPGSEITVLETPEEIDRQICSGAEVLRLTKVADSYVYVNFSHIVSFKESE